MPKTTVMGRLKSSVKTRMDKIDNAGAESVKPKPKPKAKPKKKKTVTDDFWGD